MGCQRCPIFDTARNPRPMPIPGAPLGKSATSWFGPRAPGQHSSAILGTLQTFGEYPGLLWSGRVPQRSTSHSAAGSTMSRGKNGAPGGGLHERLRGSRRGTEGMVQPRKIVGLSGPKRVGHAFQSGPCPYCRCCYATRASQQPSTRSEGRTASNPDPTSSPVSGTPVAASRSPLLRVFALEALEPKQAGGRGMGAH